jgi:hypothetical protein
MKFRLSILIIVCGAVVLAPNLAGAKVILASMELTPPNVGVLFPSAEQTIKIVVKDERPDRSFLAGGLVGPSPDKDKGIYLAYATKQEDELVSFLSRAASDAVKVLGLQTGEAGHTLEIVVKDFRVHMYRLSGFSPMNCMAYGFVNVTLTSPDGSQLGDQTIKMSFYENTNPVGSMKEVVREALSRIYMQAMWQAVAECLIDHLELTADPAEIDRVVKAVGTMKHEVDARQTIYWLGLSRHAGTPVKEKLLKLFRTSEEQRVHQAAVEAIGMLGITDAREDIESLIAGTKEIGGWEQDDQEHLWYLLNALALLGEQDLQSKIPDVDIKMPVTLEDLARFHATGELRTPGPKETDKIAKAKAKLAKKRK